MTGGLPTQSRGIYYLARECAYIRSKRFNSCGQRFGCENCTYCPHYIGNYINADPKQMYLYMRQVEYDVAQIKSDGNYISFITILPFVLIGLFGWFIWHWGITVPKRQRAEYRASIQQTTTAVAPAPVSTNSNVHKHIEDALWKVSNDLSKKVDVNSDGKINCIDAAVLFYQYYAGDKSNLFIYVNDNDKTNFHHAFNLILIDGAWRAIEPQAYWKGHKTYFVRDIWGNAYDSNLNRDGWYLYGKYVK